MFTDPEKNAPLSPDLLQKEMVVIPKLEPIEKAPAAKMASEATQAVVVGLAPSTLIINLLLGVSLKKLWAAVNLLQFVTYVNLWRVSLPANLQQFFEKASFFARGDWIPKKQIMGLFNLNSKETGNEQGLQTRFLILILVVIAVLTLLILAMIYACRRYSTRIVRICQDQKKKIFWNFLIRYQLQSYLDFSISICLQNSSSTNNKAAKKWIYLVLLLLIGGFPVGYYILLRKKFGSLRSRDLN